MAITIYKNIFDKDHPHYITVEQALLRIKAGASKKKVEAIRATLDKEKADSMKAFLPSVCFSGEFTIRADSALIKHSGFLILDFDQLDDLASKRSAVLKFPFICAVWVSPRGNGLKVLIRLADPLKHREHFAALMEIFPDADPSGVNESRVCYESYDPDIYINLKAVPFAKIKTTQKVTERTVESQDEEIFKKLLIWLSNRNDAFVTGERNVFIFKLAAACCRFGLGEDSTSNLIKSEFLSDGTFSDKECEKAIASAYRRNTPGSAVFERERLVDSVTRKEITIDASIYDASVRPKDVVYGADVKDGAMDILRNGYGQISGVGVKELDELFKPKKGESTLLTGHGNYGKSRFKKWYQVLRAILFDEKFATFPPEDYPIKNFYHDLTEIVLGCNCSRDNHNRPPEDIFSAAYDFIAEHFFYIYPKTLAPTPEYIKERFLELIIKEKIDGCDIDPFNQLHNDYSAHGGRDDRYLETTLSDFSRFGQANNVYMWIVAHPKSTKLSPNGNYPSPEVYDLSGGAMWNNKMDNILVYHRPYMQTDPTNPTCEFSSKKIRDQRIVGRKGTVSFEYVRRDRRYKFNGFDPIAYALKEKGIEFNDYGEF